MRNGASQLTRLLKGKLVTELYVAHIHNICSWFSSMMLPRNSHGFQIRKYRVVAHPSGCMWLYCDGRLFAKFEKLDTETWHQYSCFAFPSVLIRVATRSKDSPAPRIATQLISRP